MACILPATYTRNIRKTARDSLEDCMIQKSFKKCSISNSLDGTEDDILWTDVRDGTHDQGPDMGKCRPGASQKVPPSHCRKVPPPQATV